MREIARVSPRLIQWAIDRSGQTEAQLQAKFSQLPQWLSGERLPTVRQLEAFARRTMTPLGYLFLDEPPDETLPVPDFRTVGDAPIERPSPNLIETVFSMVGRQAWMREYLVQDGVPPLGFVGAAKRVRDVATLAARIRDTLELRVDWAERHRTWEEALRALRNAADRIGVLVATSSVVGLNNHRALDPEEFRGFVLCDEYAPLVFVNGADSKSAQMFTLVHELVHVWLGRDGLFNLIHTLPFDDEIERFCNQTAAEFLVPEEKLRARWTETNDTENPPKTLARSFKVSPLVVARRALDLGLISRDRFFLFYEQDQAEFRRLKTEEKNREKKGGPNFYDVQDARLGKRFATAVVRAAHEGRLLYREAYELTDLSGDTFAKYAERLQQRVVDERL